MSIFAILFLTLTENCSGTFQNLKTKFKIKYENKYSE